MKINLKDVQLGGVLHSEAIGYILFSEIKAVAVAGDSFVLCSGSIRTGRVVIQG